MGRDFDGWQMRSITACHQAEHGLAVLCKAPAAGGSCHLHVEDLCRAASKLHDRSDREQRVHLCRSHEERCCLLLLSRQSCCVAKDGGISTSIATLQQQHRVSAVT